VFFAKLSIGFLLGYLPALIHKFLLQGSSSKKAFASGSWQDLEMRFDVLLHFHREIFGLNAADTSWISFFAAAFATIGVTVFLINGLRSLAGYIENGVWTTLRTIPWALLVPVMFGIFLISRSVVDVHSQRYLVFLIPVYAVAVAHSVVTLWQKRLWAQPLIIAGVSALMWQGGTTIERDLEAAPTTGPWLTVLHELDQRGITEGYADYWLAYATSFLSNERVILEPTYSNYSPHYASPVKAAQTIAFVDFDPPRRKDWGDMLIGDVVAIKGETYSVRDVSRLSGGVVLRVLDKVPQAKP
jgi:hypothetical protein